MIHRREAIRGVVVNGGATPAMRAFGASQAVRVPAGAAEIELRVRAATVWYGLVGFVAAVVLALATRH